MVFVAVSKFKNRLPMEDVSLEHECCHRNLIFLNHREVFWVAC